MFSEKRNELLHHLKPQNLITPLPLHLQLIHFAAVNVSSILFPLSASATPLTTTCLQGYCNRLWSLTSLIQLKKPCQSDLLKHCSDHLTSLSKNFHVS